MKRRTLIFLVASILLFVGCDLAPVSQSSPRSTPMISSIDKEATKELETAILQALDGYDILVYTSEKDEKLTIDVTISGGISIDEYIYGMVVDESMKVINSGIYYNTDEIGNVNITGYGDERIIFWRSDNLQTGDFLDAPKSPSKTQHIPNATISDVLEYCKYLSPDESSEHGN